MQAMLVWLIGRRRYRRWLERSAQKLLDAVSEGIDEPQDELLVRVQAALGEQMAELRARERA